MSKVYINEFGPGEIIQISNWVVTWTGRCESKTLNQKTVLRGTVDDDESANTLHCCILSIHGTGCQWLELIHGIAIVFCYCYMNSYRGLFLS